MTALLLAPLRALSRSVARRSVIVVGAVLLVTGTLGLPGEGARAQGVPGDSLRLIDRYRMAHQQALVQKVLRERPFEGLPPVYLPTAVDSLTEKSASRLAAGEVQEEASSFPLEEVRRVRHLERSWFQNQYGDTAWSFLGPGTQLTFFDTTRTLALRARMESQFGAPTRTPAELDIDAWGRRPDSTRDAPPQFEYWFVVNDSIPVRVTDVNGPVERGVIISTDRAYRDQLPELRDALLGALRRTDPVPFADYFYDEVRGHWYRVGFDGTSFFQDRISRAEVVLGQRPEVDSVSSATDEDGSVDHP